MSVCFGRVINPNQPTMLLILVMKMAERVGFEPTVRLPVQRFSSSKILVLTCAAQDLSVCSSSRFPLRWCWLVMAGATLCRVVGLQFGLQSSVFLRLKPVDVRISLSHRRGLNHFEGALAYV